MIPSKFSQSFVGGVRLEAHVQLASRLPTSQETGHRGDCRPQAGTNHVNPARRPSTSFRCRKTALMKCASLIAAVFVWAGLSRTSLGDWPGDFGIDVDALARREDVEARGRKILAKLDRSTEPPAPESTPSCAAHERADGGSWDNSTLKSIVAFFGLKITTAVSVG
jgi:hypothetical protein